MDSTWVTIIIIAVLFLSTFTVSIPAVCRQKTSRTSGAASGALGVLDEIFHPNAYQASIIMEAQNEAGAPTPSPEEGLFPEGKIIL